MSAEVEAGTVVGRFFCPGRARTKGSMRPQPGYGKGGRKVIHMVESGEHSVPWKNAMIKVIRQTHGFNPPIKIVKARGHAPKLIFDHEPYAGPVRVDFVASFAPEISIVDGELLDSHDSAYPTAMSIGDGDKLERNLWDALTQSGLIEDDRWVAKWTGEKRWCLPGEKPGVEVQVTAL